MPYEVITFGEAMIRLSPPNFRRLEQARSLDLLVGGAELNTAVGLARLGRSPAWVSRLTRNPLGRLVANSAREAGVSTEHVVWTDGDRVGLYFLEFGAAPRASSVLYDRKGAAIARVRPGEVPWANATNEITVASCLTRLGMATVDTKVFYVGKCCTMLFPCMICREGLAA